MSVDWSVLADEEQTYYDGLLKEFKNTTPVKVAILRASQIVRSEMLLTLYRKAMTSVPQAVRLAIRCRTEYLQSELTSMYQRALDGDAAYAADKFLAEIEKDSVKERETP